MPIATRPARSGLRPRRAGQNDPLKIGLQGCDFKTAGFQGGDRLDRRPGTGDGRVIGDVEGERGAAEAEAVGDRLRALGGVEDQLDLARQHRVDDVRAALQHLVDDFDRQPGCAQQRGGAARGDEREAHLDEAAARLDHRRLVAVAHRDEDARPAAAARRRRRAATWRRRGRNRSRGPSPRRSISSPGPRMRSTPGKRAKGNTASFTATCGAALRRSSRKSASRSPAITRAAILAIGTPVALATNGTVREARGLTSST